MVRCIGLSLNRAGNVSERKNLRLPVIRLVRCAVMGGLMLAVKAALGFIPNFEMVTLLVILFAYTFGRDVFYAVAVFNVCEGIYWGFGTWWVSYLYIWNIIAALTLVLKKHIGCDRVLWSVFSAMSGLSFGFLCALVYIPVSVNTALGYWTAGLVWDIWHGICNFILMLVLFRPLSNALEKIKNI